MDESETIKRRFDLLSPVVDERTRRLVAAAEAIVLGWGGATTVSRATGVSRRTIREGIKELTGTVRLPGDRIRRPGGGRKKAVLGDPQLRTDLERLVEPLTRGDPESPLRWTCKSIRKLAAELTEMGHTTSSRMVAELLHELGYSLQANRKTLEGGTHPDRNAQFAYINERIQGYLAAGDPVISVDTKKKELVGDFKNGGRELRPKGDPERVRVHDLSSPRTGG